MACYADSAPLAITEHNDVMHPFFRQITPLSSSRHKPRAAAELNDGIASFLAAAAFLAELRSAICFTPNPPLAGAIASLGSVKIQKCPFYAE
jgi:hypothetical protein